MYAALLLDSTIGGMAEHYKIEADGSKFVYKGLLPCILILEKIFCLRCIHRKGSRITCQKLSVAPWKTCPNFDNRVLHSHSKMTY